MDPTVRYKETMMEYQTIEDVCEGNLREWGYLNKGKYSDECWKIQFAGPSVCERCDRQDAPDDCPGIFIRHTHYNEIGHRVPLRRSSAYQLLLPGMNDRMMEEAVSDETSIRIMIDEGMRRAPLIQDKIVPAVFECANCKGKFWFESKFTTSILGNPDDEDPDEDTYCSDDCRMYGEEDSQWCESCNNQIRYDHFTYNETIGDPVCSKCVKDEFISGTLLDDFISNDKIPPDFGVVAPDDFKHIKAFDEWFIEGAAQTETMCRSLERLQERGHVLVLRPSGETREDHGSVEVFIKPFSKNKLRKARKYGISA